MNPTLLRDKLQMFNPRLPLDAASTIPPLWYFDTEIAEAEARNIFHKQWILAGRREQVVEPGFFITAEIAGESVVVARDREGKLGAFSNVCRHRGSRILTAPCGKAAALQCRYHGWNYDLSGALKRAPEFEGVLNFPFEANGLPKYRVAEWGPFVFVNLDSDASSFEEVYSELIERTEHVNWSAHKFVRQTVYDIECNWKVFVDNYLDGGYHVNTLHKALAGVIDYSKYRTEVFSLTSLQSTPLRPGTDETVTHVRKGDLAYYWWGFPNFMLNIYEGVIDTNLVLPLGPNRCRVLFDYYFIDTDSSEARAFIEKSIAVAHQVQLEDQEISESVQKGIQSPNYQAGRFSLKREVAGYHFHQLLHQELMKGMAVGTPS